MLTSPKLHNKFQKSKHAAVSLNSLLGVLASAYGTEELDSKLVFDSNTVNWKNISVENLKLKREKAKEENGKKSDNKKELEKISVSTSTSNLKSLRNVGSNNDVTLATIKSLEDLNQFNLKKSLSSSTLNPTVDQTTGKSEVGEYVITDSNTFLSSTTIDNNNSETMVIDEHCVDIGRIESTAICGFIGASFDKKVVFDIKFVKIIRNLQLPIFDPFDKSITITLMDLVNKTSSSIELSKRSMTSKCFYFANVDKEYGLENLEVYVKCNSSHFIWVIEWIKAELSQGKPILCVNNLKDILFIAYHLKINDLIEECLEFFHHHFKSVLAFDREIEHLFVEDLSVEFVKRVSNAYISEISDEYESFTVNMFCDLIKLLADENICFKAGHYSTLATIFQCTFCDKLLNYNVMGSVPCSIHHTRIDFRGELKYDHECSPEWDLSKYIELIFEEFQNWKLVYWYLWGMCHFVYCIECRTPYPISQSEWCAYHPDDVVYFPLSSDVSYPIGSFTCCGEKVFKFNVLQQYSGCMFKSHIPDLNLVESKEIYNLYEKYKHLISFKPPDVSTKKFLKFLKKDDNDFCDQNVERFWWDGIQIAPKEKKDYSIISVYVLNRLRNKHIQKRALVKCKPLTYRPQVQFGLISSLENIEGDSESVESSFSMLCKTNKPISINKSKVSHFTKTKNRSNKSYHMKYRESGGVWSNSLSIKDNQENQRDFEEVAMSRLIRMLTPGLVCQPMVGSYVRIEAEWWLEHHADFNTPNNTNIKKSNTVINRTFPLSWVRRNRV